MSVTGGSVSADALAVLAVRCPLILWGDSATIDNLQQNQALSDCRIKPPTHKKAPQRSADLEGWLGRWGLLCATCSQGRDTLSTRAVLARGLAYALATVQLSTIGDSAALTIR